MPLNQTSGNATADSFGGGGLAIVPNYIEDVFSTYLYTGNGSSQTITNGIDLSTKGGLVWLKSRSQGSQHFLEDSNRGISGTGIVLNSASANPASNDSNGSNNVITSLNTDGFTLGTGSGFAASNVNTQTYTSWTFAEQPKFFDVVTYTGNGTSGRTVSHSLGSTPGCIIVKNTSNTADWAVYHRSLGSTKYITLNATDAAATDSSFWNNTDPTSTNFTVGSGGHQVNWNGETYVAYLFAHDAGGFGLTGTDNVISCGSFTTDGSGNATVSLGYEPQWVMIKNSSSAGYPWYMFDNMRGMTVGGDDAMLQANSANAEASNNIVNPSATGFSFGPGATSNTYIYIAIRRGPMKVPTDATKVFLPISTPPSSTVNVGFVPDVSFPTKQTDNGVGSSSAGYVGSRLQGNSVYLATDLTSAEGAFGWVWDSPSTKFSQSSVATPVYSELFARAPGFFDEVCYTGTGSAGTQTHNLGVAPELIIIKKRSATGNWAVGVSFTSTNSKVGYLNTDYDLGTAAYSSGGGFSGQPTSTTFSVGTDTSVNASGATYVAYLFATCAGVSKVGSYTGTGATQTINCGFTGGTRFVLIKRTDSTGDWWYWDTTRGMVAGNDQRMALNTQSVQATANWVYTTTGGFQIVTTNADVNANGGSYIYLAIA